MNSLLTSWPLAFMVWAAAWSNDAHAFDVDPFIGTGGPPQATGNVFPGATLPFGAVRLSPDASYGAGTLKAWLAERVNLGTAGYYEGFTNVLGFSHTRLSGAGIREGGLFRVLPTTEPAPEGKWPEPPLLVKPKEKAEPGYYAAELGGGLLAELTATPHVGVHRYTFPAGTTPHVLIDVASSLGPSPLPVTGTAAALAGQREIEGQGHVSGAFSQRFGGVKAYFVARASAPFSSASIHGTVMDLAFATTRAPTSIEIQLAISFVSIQGARANLEAETKQLDFDAVRKRASDAWHERLAAIRISTSDPRVAKTFDTALYHAMIMPTNVTDVGGSYLAMDGSIAHADSYTHRSDFSLWDTFRTVHPLLTLIAPDVQRDSVRSLAAMARRSGRLPLWPAAHGEAECMIGSPASIVLAEAFLKGATDFDANYVLDLALKADGRGACLELGYCPTGEEVQSVSRTLEYAWADDASSRLAAALGRVADAEFLRRRSRQYRSLWDASSGHFRPRYRDGGWRSPFFPELLTFFDELVGGLLAGDYTEGSAAQWRWSVPFDADGLIELFGSRERFVSELEAFMSGAAPQRASTPVASYWHGNEHNLHAAYLFTDAGRPDLTQKWVRWALTTRYAATADGLDGQDDAGTLSAWYVFSALGIYPRAGSTQYWLGSPLVDSARVRLGNGAEIVIETVSQSPEHPYVASVLLNGERLCAPFLSHEDIARGARLTFTMTGAPTQRMGYDCSADKAASQGG
jgi:predicted alpha-1,2-mannosidase